MSWDSGLQLSLTTGAAAVLGGYLAWKIKSEQHKLAENKEKELSEVIHQVPVQDIAELLKSENGKIRHQARQLLVQRASRQQHLTYILKQCLSSDMKQVAKATTALHLLAGSSEENKAKLLNHKALVILAQTLSKISDNFDYMKLVENCKNDINVETVLFRCIGCIFHLTLNDSLSILELAKESDCIRIFLNILGDHSLFISPDIKRWTTFFVHQLSQCDLNPIKKNLRKWGVIRKATFCIIKTLGELLQTQLCLQIIVQYLNDSVEEIVQVCQEMTTLGILPHLVGLLRCDEEESIIQLSAVIIHHFCCFDLEITNLACTPGIVKILYTVLNSTDASTQKTILRICNYLVVGSTRFRRQMLNYKPMIKKLAICLASGNSDVVYGSLMLLHDLAMPGKKSVQKLIHANHEIIQALVTLSFSSSGDTVQLIAETLGFICSCESLHSLILKHNVVNAILHFAKSGDTAVQFWASALLLNLSMISDDIKEKIIRSGGVHILLEMAVSGDEVELPDISTNATKTLVILGFLDTCIDVKLVSGQEGSIIIDGTERCPGKQGINLISLDFTKYQYSKGQVIQPEDFASFLSQHFDSIKSDPLFVVTQGDCTVFNEDQKIPEFATVSDLHFLHYPSWCAVLSSDHVLKMIHGDESLMLNTKIPMKVYISCVLQENFTDPLIDVLLSMPPSSNISKTDELELIEILARHSFQKKCIVSSSGFLEYLNELIWSVASLNCSQLSEPENTVKVSHCIAALKILHACSIEEASVNELIRRGLLNPLQSLLIAIVPSMINKEVCTSESNMTILEEEQKPAWFDLIETSKENDLLEKDLAEEFNALKDDDLFSTIQMERLDLNISDSHDNIFDDSRQDTSSSVPVTGESRPRTVTYAEDVEYIDTILETAEDFNPSTTQASRRLRTDSFIMRSDSRNTQLDNYRSQSVLEHSISLEPNDQQRLISVTSPRLNRPVSSDHQQMRRISRSMSFSMQQAKSVDDLVIPELVNISDVLKQLVKHTVMIMYHIISFTNEDIEKYILDSKLLPLLQSLLGCLSGTFKQRIGLAVSSLIMKMSKNKLDDLSETREEVYVTHTEGPRSCVLSSNCLEVSNENWFFETIRGSQGVSQTLFDENDEHPVGWYYEVIVLTDGIMQIGWSNKDCVFNAEKGIGVGDNLESYGYDGARCKLWHGPSKDIVQNNDYGIEWQAGDVISVLLSWDGVLSFWLNGKDLGIAVQDVNTTLMWYPAVSLSIDQHCRFIFKQSSCRHNIPDGYITISEDSFKDASELNPVSNYPIVDAMYTLTDWRKRQMLMYYEIDVSNLVETAQIVIGYKYIKCSETQRNPKDKEIRNRELNIDTVSDNMIFAVNKTLIKHETERKVSVIGCGIVQPAFQLLITKDGEPVFEKPVVELLPDPLSMDEVLLDLVPYVSPNYSRVNIGQDDFIYEEANSVLCKHKALELISQLVTKV